MEYWTPEEPYEAPKVEGMWSFKSSTDLFDFKKVSWECGIRSLDFSISTPSNLKSSNFFFDISFQTKSHPLSLTISPNSLQFCTTSFPDRTIRIFDFLTGKLTRKYDESLRAVQEMQQAGTAIYKLEEMEFGRRLAQERDLDKSCEKGPVDAVANATGSATSNAVFDESGKYLIFPSMLGIKSE